MKKPQLPSMKKGRAGEIFSVFAKHNFFVGGLTPKELRTTLEDLGPTYVKIGQIMSSRSDLLPEAYCKELEKLRSDVKPLDASEVRAVIEKETGRRIEDIYSEFDDKPLGSASIAQAHYGVLKDGTRVVTKVQRPYIADMMRRDFVLLKKLAAVVNVAGESDRLQTNMIDLKSVFEELEKVTEEELDFRIEAENTRLFKEQCIEDPEVVDCPGVIDSLSTERILTLTYVDGYSLAKADQKAEESLDRMQIARALLENYMHQVLDVGTFHGDPHQGNIMISHGKPVWIDFGMIGRISEQGVNTMQEIVVSLVMNDTAALTEAALSLGVAHEKVDKAKLSDDLEGLVKQYISTKSISHIDIGAMMTDLFRILAEYKIEIPGEYTMLVRSLVTIEGVIASFCPDLNILEFLTRAMLKRAKENFDLREKLHSLLESVAVAGLRSTRLPSLTMNALKNLLKGRMKLNIELSGHDEMFGRLNVMIKNVILAAFACVLFVGSCVLCTTNIQPQVGGMPLLALIGFVFATALAIHTVVNMLRKK